MPYDLNVDPNDPDADRKRRLWELMQASINQKPTVPAINNPVGFAGGTLQGQIARDQQPRGPMAGDAGPAVDMPAPPPSAPAVNIPANASLAAPPSGFPNPSMPEAPGGFPAPPTSAQPGERPILPGGSSLGGLLGSERTSKILEAMRTADPESKISTTGGNVEVGPPHMGGYGFKGRLKAAGKGLLLGLATGDPNAPQSAGVGRALGGLITGAVSPRTEAKVQRGYDIHKQEGDLARQLQLEQGQAQIGDIQAQSRQRELEPAIKAAEMQQQMDYHNAQLKIERDKAAGLITKEQADIEQRKLDRKSREDIAGKNITSREKIAQMGGSSGTEKPKELNARQRNYTAAETEYNSLIEREKAAAAEKDKAYAKVGEIQSQLGKHTVHETDEKGNPTGRDVDEPLITDPKKRAELEKQLAEAQREADRAQGYYAGFGDKKDKARAEMLKHADTDESGNPVAPQAKAPATKLTTSGFVDAFKKSRNRAPTAAEIAAFESEYPQ